MELSEENEHYYKELYYKVLHKLNLATDERDGVSRELAALNLQFKEMADNTEATQEDAKEKMEELQGELSDVTEERDNVRDKWTSLKLKYKHQKGTICESSANLKGAEKELETVQKQLGVVTAERDSLSASLGALELQVQQRQKAEDKAKCRLEGAKKQVEELQGELSDVTEERDKVRDKWTSLKLKYKHQKEAAVSGLTAELEAKKTELATVREERDAAVVKFENSVGQLAEKDYTISRLRSRLKKTVNEQKGGAADVKGGISAETQAAVDQSSSLKRNAAGSELEPLAKKLRDSDNLGRQPLKELSASDLGVQPKYHLRSSQTPANKGSNSTQISNIPIDPEKSIEKKDLRRPTMQTCLTCRKRFARKVDFRRHTNKMEFQCRCCNQRYHGIISLNRHLSGWCILQCCGIWLHSYDLFKKHYKMRHCNEHLKNLCCPLCPEKPSSLPDMWYHRIKAHSLTIVRGCTV